MAPLPTRPRKAMWLCISTSKPFDMLMWVPYLCLLTVFVCSFVRSFVCLLVCLFVYLSNFCWNMPVFVEQSPLSVWQWCWRHSARDGASAGGADHGEGGHQGDVASMHEQCCGCIDDGR
jgi:hypothetical protein